MQLSGFLARFQSNQPWEKEFWTVRITIIEDIEQALYIVRFIPIFVLCGIVQSVGHIC